MLLSNKNWSKLNNVPKNKIILLGTVSEIFPQEPFFKTVRTGEMLESEAKVHVAS